jgi:type I restriction enzyme S subunit
MNEWTSQQLGDLFDIDTTACVPSKTPWQRFAHLSIPAWDDINGPRLEMGKEIESNKFAITKRCIVVSKLNPRIPRVMLYDPSPFDDPVCASTELIVYVPKSEETSLEYFRHYFLCARFRWMLERIAIGTTNSHVRLRPQDTLRWSIPSPEECEQRTISTILDAADAAIERTSEALEQARQVRNGLLVELLSCGIGEDGRVRDSRLTPEQFQPTAIGRVPSEWIVSSVGLEFDLQTGFTLNTNRRPVLNKRKYLRVANVQRARLDLSDIAELEAGEDEFQKRKLREGDLLVVEGHANSMQIGRCAMVTGEAAGLTFQNHLYCLRPSRVESEFGGLWLNSAFAQRYWRRVCSTTSGLNTINQRKLKRMPFPVPQTRERQRICEVAHAATSLVTATQEKLASLLQLKRGLMQDLLTGKVRVPVKLEVAES